MLIAFTDLYSVGTRKNDQLLWLHRWNTLDYKFGSSNNLEQFERFLRWRTILVKIAQIRISPFQRGFRWKLRSFGFGPYTFGAYFYFGIINKKKRKHLKISKKIKIINYFFIVVVRIFIIIKYKDLWIRVV